jgi:hypothetical protein
MDIGTTYAVDQGQTFKHQAKHVGGIVVSKPQKKLKEAVDGKSGRYSGRRLLIRSVDFKPVPFHSRHENLALSEGWVVVIRFDRDVLGNAAAVPLSIQ